MGMWCAGHRSCVNHMGRAISLSVICVFLALLGCSKESKRAAIQQSQTLDVGQPDTIVQTQLDDLGRSLVTRKCPNPIGTESKHVQNNHDPKVTDEIRKIVCDGYEMQIYLANFTNPAKELPLKLTIHRKLEYIKPSQYIGGNSTLVVKTYGHPLQIEGEDIVYRLDEAVDNSVTYKVKNGLVEKIMWSWDVD